MRQAGTAWSRFTHHRQRQGAAYELELASAKYSNKLHGNEYTKQLVGVCLKQGKVGYLSQLMLASASASPAVDASEVSAAVAAAIAAQYTRPGKRKREERTQE